MSFAWRGLEIEILDLVALAACFVLWIGHARFAKSRAQRVPSLLGVIFRWRALETLKRKSATLGP
jgi:hypothetical protein